MDKLTEFETQILNLQNHASFKNSFNIEYHNLIDEIEDYLKHRFSEEDAKNFLKKIEYYGAYDPNETNEYSKASPEEEKSQLKGFIETLNICLNQIKIRKQRTEYKSQSNKEIISKAESNKVFLVFGHDEKFKLEVENFLYSEDLKPIVLDQQANKGKTIIEKLEHHSNVSYAIVLLSPDDATNEKEVYRVRQNVIFEFGYFVSKLTRENISIITKNKHEMEFFSDIDGICYIEYEKDWKEQLRKEFKAAKILIY